MTQWIVSSSILILIVMGLRFLLRRRISPGLQYALWGLVLIRLLLPFQLGSASISVQNAAENIPVIQQMVTAEHRVYLEEFGGFDELKQPSVDPLGPGVEIPIPPEIQAIVRTGNVIKLLIKVWIGGMIVMGLIFLLSNLRFALQMKAAKRDPQQEKLPVFITDKVETPCLFGLFRPAIYLPPAVAQEERHRAYSIAHELTHFRHGDHIWSILRCLCIVVHWYNPLVWWAAVLSREDGEIACDEATLQRLGEPHRAEYGRVLIDLTCRKRTDMLQTATTMTGSARGLKQRITMIVKRPKMALYALIALVLAASIAVGCTFTGGKPGDLGTEDTTESTGSTEDTSETGDTTEETAGSDDEPTAEQTFQNLLTKNYWYCRALGCTFERPEDISAEHFFYNGLDIPDRERPNTYTDEEKAFLDTKALWGGDYQGFIKLPVAKMNQALSILNITAADLKIPTDWVYYDQTDSYYVYHTDAFGVVGVTVTDVKENADGTVQVYWQTDMMHHNTATGEFWHHGVKMVITLRKTPNGSYQILSNVPVQ